MPVGRDFPPFQTGRGAHPASCTMGIGSFPGVKNGRGVTLATHPLLVPRSWKCRDIPLPTLWATTGPVMGTLYLHHSGFGWLPAVRVGKIYPNGCINVSKLVLTSLGTSAWQSRKVPYSTVNQLRKTVGPATYKDVSNIPYPTAFPYGNGMVLHFYQQQESSTTKTVHKVINKGLKTYVQSPHTGENFH